MRARVGIALLRFVVALAVTFGTWKGAFALAREFVPPKPCDDVRVRFTSLCLTKPPDWAVIVALALGVFAGLGAILATRRFARGGRPKLSFSR